MTLHLLGLDQKAGLAKKLNICVLRTLAKE